MSFKANKIGEKIKKFREMRNFTQDYIAKKLEMTPQGYGKIERNEVEITIQKLTIVAEILNTTIQDILGFEDKFVFNNQEHYQNNVINNDTTNFQELKLVYEKMIKSQEKEITYLRSVLERTLAR
ncbi:MAG: XRE family transcriptional regulator [Bacteroidetes bacterium]|nr:MAG: XRE family transcriptional regulator [Bacteroidota bacterium]TAG88737.1 MAG: XRE family transcriptional regulator [Bacteroidota bacterium]